MANPKLKAEQRPAPAPAPLVETPEAVPEMTRRLIADPRGADAKALLARLWDAIDSK